MKKQKKVRDAETEEAPVPKPAERRRRDNGTISQKREARRPSERKEVLKTKPVVGFQGKCVLNPTGAKLG